MCQRREWDHLSIWSLGVLLDNISEPRALLGRLGVEAYLFWGRVSKANSPAT